MLDRDHVENVAASLVREYLSRKGLKASLQSMDQELPRTEGSISNRLELAREVHIEKLLKKNKEQEEPLRSMIEIITKYFLEKAPSSSAKPETVPLQRTAVAAVDGAPSSGSRDGDRVRHDGENNNSSGAPKSRGSRKTASSKQTRPSQHDTKDLDFGAGLPQEDLGGSYGLPRGSTPVVTIRERPNAREPERYLEQTAEGRLAGKPQQAGTKTEAAVKRAGQRPASASRSRGLGGPVTSSLDSHDRRKPVKKPPSTRMSLDNGLTSSSTAPSSSSSSSFDRSLDESAKSERSPVTSASNRSRLKGLGFNFDSPPESQPTAEAPQRRPDSRGRRSLTESEAPLTDGPRRDPTTDAGKSRTSETKSKEEPDRGRWTPAKQALGDVELGDIDDLDNDLGNLQLGPTAKKTVRAADARPITQEQAIELKNLLFGSASGFFNDEWRMQGLGFNDMERLEFGIVQHKGGPCGVLASIQACFLRHLLFGQDRVSTVASLRPGARDRSEILGRALGEMVWRAGQAKTAVVALPSSRSQFTSSGRYRADGLTEKLTLNHFKKKEEVLEFVSAHVGVFESNASSGCILALYSAILSRTVDKVIEDMDEPTNRLMGAHGYCTQEMVNLLLTGKAVSNVFNDVMELDSGTEDKVILRGVGQRSDMGLLSLFEHYGSCKVGSNYKTPRYPIWVVCSESHFSVLFCLKRELLSDWKVERRFDLYYYDGLSRQQDEIRLSIDTTQNCSASNDDDLVPPLEHCIRTKWPDAVVNWNSTEPIL